MDLDQSNASGALVWSGSIRCVGLGSATVGLGFPLCFSWINCYVYPYACYLNPLLVLKILQKIPKITMWLWCICGRFCDIITWTELIKVIGVNSPWIGTFCVFLVNFLVWLFHPNFCHMILVLGIWFYDDYLCFLINSFNLGKFNFLLFWCNILNFVELEFCDIPIFFVKFDPWLQFCGIL